MSAFPESQTRVPGLLGDHSQFTDTTKTAGVSDFEARTDSYQVGVGYNFNKSFTSKLRFTRFDNPIDNADLDEYTLNLAYNFDGVLENWSVVVDFSTPLWVEKQEMNF